MNLSIAILSGVLCISLLILSFHAFSLEQKIKLMGELYVDLAEFVKAINQRQDEFKETLNAVVWKCSELDESIQLLAKVQSEQSIYQLRSLLLKLVDGDKEAAKKMIELERIANPGQSEEWYLKRVIFDLNHKNSLNESQSRSS